MATAPDKKVVVLTGCSSGIGFETSVLLAKDGKYKVYATMRSLDDKKALKKAAGSFLKKTLFIRELDISKEESITEFVGAILKVEGRIDVLINNAGSGQFGAFEDVSMWQMQTLFQTNFFGTVRITQEVVREMKKRKSGRIIFVTGRGGFDSFPFMDFYVASKFAIEGLAGCLAPVLLQFNISLTTIQPGPVRTPFTLNIDKNQQGGGGGLDKATPETRHLMMTFLEKSSFILKEETHKVEEVAEAIKTCIESDNPDLRIQPSSQILAKAKLCHVDPTGNTMRQKLADLMTE